MAVEDFGGKVLGRTIEVIGVDHQTKPDIGSNLARQLIDQDHVSMLNIGGSSGVGLAVQNVARERKIVSIQSGNYAASISGTSCSPYGTQWAVVTTALGIPEQIAFQPIGTQEKAITDHVDIKRFKSPAFVEQFTRRYLIQAGAAANTSASTSSSLFV